MSKKKVKVRGLRNCSCGCRGLLSTGVKYRTKWGQRRRYFENRNHIKQYIYKDLKKRFLKDRHLRGVNPSDKSVEEQTNWYIKEFLEKIDYTQSKERRRR